MIRTQPCGCKTKPVNRSYKIKGHLIEGNVIWLDDPRCEEHNGTGIQNVFMVYQDGAVHTNLIVDDTNLELTDAIFHLNELFKFGVEFSVGKARLEIRDNVIGFSCGGPM